jgi:Methyltransferase FkbM domain
VIFDDNAKPLALLQGCDMVYVDVGTNIGVQIRKLYEPARYPGAAVIPIFDQVFGRNRSSVCAVGFEMNPAHTKRLQALQEHYTQTCGHRVHIFTETAASVRNESVQFWSDNAIAQNEWGASIEYNWNITGARSSMVQAVDLADFLTREVFPHASTVVMKLDIEGAESRVLPRLLLKGALCTINTAFIEVHGPPMVPAAESPLINRIVQDFPDTARLAGCKTILSPLDDESFLHDADNTLSTC